jgi:RHS repeat-associated protein
VWTELSRVRKPVAEPDNSCEPPALSDANHPPSLLSTAHFNAAGSLLTASLGNGINETQTYDSRLRLSSITDGSAYSLSIPSSGGYAPNGDILAANDSVNGNWTHTYDDFNSLLGANQNSGAQVYSYDYDRFGNRWHQNGPHSMMLSFSGLNNRMDSYSYDAAGNLLNDGAHTYTYDAENRITQVDAGATASYLYDAEGRRVQKTTSAGTVNYLYDQAAHVVTELSSSGGWNRGEIYVGGKHLATYNNSTTYFIHADWLGTERARSTVSGVLCETITSLPYGDGQVTTPVGSGCGDPSPLHFTGKQRDAESGLDDFEARYYSSSLGRFMIPDWAAKPTAVPYAEFGDPQSLNLYGYVKNNPTTRSDADGHCYPWCTVAVGAVVGGIAGGGTELLHQAFTGTGKVDWSKVGNAAAGGAVTGAIVGLAGPEAGLGAKVAIGVGGSVVGGGVERSFNGQPVLDPKAVAIDAAARAVAAGISHGVGNAIPSVGTGQTVTAGADSLTVVIRNEAQAAVENGIRNIARTGANMAAEGAIGTASNAAKDSTQPLPPPPPPPFARRHLRSRLTDLMGTTRKRGGPSSEIRKDGKPESSLFDSHWRSDWGRRLMSQEIDLPLVS